MTHIPPHMMQTLIPVAIIAAVLLLRARRMGRKQPLKLGLLWLRPAILLLVCAAALFLPQPGHPAAHFTAQGWVFLAATAATGMVGGWYLGRAMAIDVHPENGTLMVQASPIGLIVLVMLVVIRMGVRTGADMEAQAWHLDVPLIIDVLIVFTAALFTARSVEMFLRARRVMRGAQAPL